MSDINIRRLDLSLLMVLASLLRTHQATATAQQLRVTQSSISHALARLRDVFGDELFVRRPQGLEPTARALGLRPVVDQIIDLARSAVSPEPFDPATAHGLVRIAGTDYPCTLLAAPLLERLGREAPNLRVSFRSIVRQKAALAIRAGELDFAIGPFVGTSSPFDKRLLWEDDYSVVVRKKHPTIEKSCGISTYAAARHVLVSQAGDLIGIVDSALAAREHVRTVTAAVPYFLTALAMVARSNAIATMPTLIARAHAEDLGLRLFPCPVALRKLRVHMISAQRVAGNPVNSFVAGVIAELSAELVGRSIGNSNQGNLRKTHSGSQQTG